MMADNNFEISLSEEFQGECVLQFHSSGVPRHMWGEAVRKLSEEIYDAGDYLCWCKCEVKDEQNESPTYLTYLTPSDEEGLKAANPASVFVIDHAWVFEPKDAEQQLATHPSLLTRMCKLLNIKYEEQDGRLNIKEVLKEMWRFCYTFKIRTADMAPHEAKIMWYINDEVGSTIHHSDDPNCKMAPIYFRGSTFTLLWPVRDIEHEEMCTVDRVMPTDSPKIRQARCLPWIPSDMTEVSFTQHEPDASYFEAYRRMETLPDPDIEYAGLPRDRKLRVYVEYQNFDQFLTDPRFELVETEDEADIVWTQTTFKDFRNLSLKSPGCHINQFPCENVLTIKDLLAIVARRAASSPCKDPLNPGPRWLPVTYNLETELAEFVSYFQTREKNGLDNVWICKPWNLARGMDITITDNLSCIVRLPETGPKVACKYVETPVLFDSEDVGLVKFDVRYIVLLRSTNPLSLYAYKVFWLRFANKPFALDDFYDYEKHFTVMNYRPGTVLKQVNYDEFIPMFEKQYPEFSWGTVEASIFEMIQELFEAAVSKPPPMGIGHNPQSRALYAVDLLLKWEHTSEGERCIVPQLCEVNFGPDCERACKYHPFFVNDIFSVLFLDETEDRHVVKIA